MAVDFDVDGDHQKSRRVDVLAADLETRGLNDKNAVFQIIMRMGGAWKLRSTNHHGEHEQFRF
jgi:hypothetical protein